MGIGAGKNDLRAVRPLFHRLHVAADAFADLVFLGRDALAVGQQRLVFAEVHHHIGALEAAHRAADDVPTRSLNSSKISCFLRPAEVLHQRLLGVLRGDAAEADRGDLHFQFLANLRVRL